MANLHQTEELKILGEKIKNCTPIFKNLTDELGKVIIGQSYMVQRLLIALLSDGHILLEGLPGLAKTLAIKTLSQALEGEFSRIQFTPDLLPADVVGTMIFNIKENNFSLKKGAVFANFILADEINRAPAKVQSALLEVMQERQVTIDGNTLTLPSPFLVLATQNPIDQEGTYPLPEAQTDRFMFKCKIDYPSFEEEKQIIQMISSHQIPQIKSIISIQDLVEAKELIHQIYIDEKIEKYILDIVFATRYPEQYGLTELKNYINFGASPRASINLAIASKTLAFLNGRAYVVPEDVKNLAEDVLRHRIGINFEAEAENINQEGIIQKIINRIAIP